MCGLAGYISRSGQAEIGVLQRMTACIDHRGPDDDGHKVLGAVGLGHRRLSIVDLSPQGHQPMPAGDESCWIAFNGEIYNHAEIRKGLPQGPGFRGHSDTEVLARALQTQGEAAIPGLNGIFAFAFVDTSKRQVLIARDHFGIKPMYFAEDGERFYFASEIKSILAAGFKAEPNPLAALDLAYTGWTNDDRTFINGIRRLPPGSLLRYDLTTHRFEVARYHTPEPVASVRQQVGDSFEAWRDAIDTQLQKTIDLQLMSDVPVGTFCSGGIDSSLVTALAARRHSGLAAFNVACPDTPEVDEGKFAKAVADHVKIPLNTFNLTRESFRKALVHAVWVTEYPLSFVNTVPLYLISQMARDMGFKVLLSGEGADENFGGYVGMYRALAMRLVAQKSGPLGGAALKLASRLVAKLGPALDYTPPRPAMAAGMHDVLTGGLRTREIRRHATEASKIFDTPIERELSAELLKQLQSYILPILHRCDRASMAASIEARVPFLDPDLVRLAISMPPRHKVTVKRLRPQGKAILKDIAARHLPHDIVYRPKMGFSVPTNYYTGAWPKSWLHEGYLVSTYGISPQDLARWISDERSQSLAWLLTLEIWGQLFIRGRSRADISAEFLA
jgi:asparagine synthase (glutamine-hydrolysing)